MKIRFLGDGPPLVLLPGWAMHSGVFGSFTQALARHWTVYLVDLPGHGEQPADARWSPAELAAQLLPELPVAAWLGWSLGGQVALQAAMQQPASVRTLLLMGVNPCFVARPGWACGMDAAVFAEFEHHCQDDPRATIEQFLALQTARSRQATAVMRELRRLHAAAPFPDQASLLRGLYWLRQADFRAALPGIDTPALWIAGQRDALAPVASSHAGAGLMPQGRVFELPGAGHAPFLSHAEPLLAQLQAFDTQVAPA